MHSLRPKHQIRFSSLVWLVDGYALAFLFVSSRRCPLQRKNRLVYLNNLVKVTRESGTRTYTTTAISCIIISVSRERFCENHSIFAFDHFSQNDSEVASHKIACINRIYGTCKQRLRQIFVLKYFRGTQSFISVDICSERRP